MSNNKSSPSKNNILTNDDEKPCRRDDRRSSNDSITDEINQSRFPIKDHKEVLLKAAVSAQEFVPSWSMLQADEKCAGAVGDEKCIVPQQQQPFEDLFEDTVVLWVLDEVIAALVEDPGDFDNVIEQLTDHLVNFVTQEDTLKQVIDRIIGKALAEPHFSFLTARLAWHFDQCKTVELENGVTFRKVFFRSCQAIHGECMALCKDAESVKENKQHITRIALLFGELLCNMKLKDKVNPLFRNVINSYIDTFLNIASDESVTILTTLLKLVGPELDINRPKDVEALFDKVKDFYLDSSRSGHLSKLVRTNLWGVYKLHSRDWDRATSPLDAPSNFSYPAEPPPVHSSSNPLIRQKSIERQRSLETQRSIERQRSHSSRSSPIDWNEYYDGGDDLELYQNYMDRNTITDEEEDAFEEFLKQSGQV
jgi:hypothetical protein